VHLAACQAGQGTGYAKAANWLAFVMHKADIGMFACAAEGGVSKALRITTPFDIPEYLLSRTTAFEAAQFIEPPALPGVSD
jgi:hypothetical protein